MALSAVRAVRPVAEAKRIGEPTQQAIKSARTRGRLIRRQSAVSSSSAMRAGRRRASPPRRLALSRNTLMGMAVIRLTLGLGEATIEALPANLEAQIKALHAKQGRG